MSSLGRSELDVLSGLDQVLQRLAGMPLQNKPNRSPQGKHASPPNWLQAESLLHAHTYGLLGPRPHNRHIFIMVTAPSDVPSADWCRQLLEAGMNVLRINTAHGNIASWTQTARLANETAKTMQQSLKIMFDFGGQKIRIAPFIPGPNVLKLKPKKDRQGRVTENLRVYLYTPAESIAPEAEPVLGIPATILSRLAVNDTLQFTDCRGRERTLTICEISTTQVVAEINRTAYVSDQTQLQWYRQERRLEKFVPLGIPPLEDYAQLGEGDHFELVLDANQLSVGRRLVVPIGPATLMPVPGQRVSLDDGKVEAVIDSVADNVLQCRVIHATKKQVKIRGHKGISFAAEAMTASVLSNDDLAVLPLILEFAEIIGISFVRSASDIADVHTVLDNLNHQPTPGIVIKIETESAVENLPGILLEAMKHYPTGVMIARGDLATEIGYERLAEIQQEILWFCEAAHVPVIWATQVLENLTHTGVPSRAEVTDAASATQAECIMLNKGDHVCEAAQTLRDIIGKMEQHQYKKRSLYRALRISKGALLRPKT